MRERTTSTRVVVVPLLELWKYASKLGFCVGDRSPITADLQASSKQLASFAAFVNIRNSSILKGRFQNAHNRGLSSANCGCCSVNRPPIKGCAELTGSFQRENRCFSLFRAFLVHPVFQKPLTRTWVLSQSFSGLMVSSFMIEL